MSKSNEVKKYLKNGAISPLWQEIQYQKACDDYEDERLRKLNGILSKPCIDNKQFELEPCNSFNPIDIGINKDELKPMIIINAPRDIKDVYEELNDRYDFLSEHYDGDDGLCTKLAKIVLETF